MAGAQGASLGRGKADAVLPWLLVKMGKGPSITCLDPPLSPSPSLSPPLWRSCPGGMLGVGRGEPRRSEDAPAISVPLLGAGSKEVLEPTQALQSKTASWDLWDQGVLCLLLQSL